MWSGASGTKGLKKGRRKKGRVEREGIEQDQSGVERCEDVRNAPEGSLVRHRNRHLQLHPDAAPSFQRKAVPSTAELQQARGRVGLLGSTPSLPAYKRH